MPTCIQKNIPTQILRRTVAVIIAIALLQGCATLNHLIEKPTATFNSMTITQADLVQSTAVFNFDIKNPNPINIGAGRVTYQLKLNGKDFVSGELEEGITLIANSTSPLQVPVTLPYLDFFESLTQMWRARRADYELAGNFAVGPFTIPYQAKGSFDLPKMPGISLEAIRVEKMSLLGAKLNCRLKMNNPNAFDLRFKRLDYNLNLGGTSFAKTSILPQGLIGKNAATAVDFDIDVSFAQLGRTAYQLLQGRTADYTLNGDLVFDPPGQGEKSVPFDLSGVLPFIK